MAASRRIYTAPGTPALHVAPPPETHRIERQTVLISLNAAARLLGVHHRTVRRWIGDGTLPSIQTSDSGARKIYRWAVEEFGRYGQIEGTDHPLPGQGGPHLAPAGDPDRA